MCSRHPLRGDVRLGAAILVGSVLAAMGCQGPQATQDDEPAPAGVTILRAPAGATEDDRNRIALARFVGAWDYAGWYTPEGRARETSEGIAAGTIEHEYYVLLDGQYVREEAGTASYHEGSMLFSSEPGLGLMMTSWSNAGPSVQRFRGRVEREGTRFVFDEVERVGGGEWLRLVVSFETDNTWTADFYRRGSPEDILAASYTFTRAD